MKKQINEINKNKKIAKYADFSTVLKWYQENKQKIANILDVNINELETEDNLIQQSSELINLVINPQSQGNRYINDQVEGFKEFNKIEKNLIHDILHNLYNVEMKKFNKSLERLEFNESEIVEEIECLAIEESFMKFLNIPYLKSDFINTNINNLYSYLVLSILKNDPDRIENFLEGKEKGYIEVYGKKYYTEGTPFEPIFTNLESLPVNPYNIKNDSDYRVDDTDINTYKTKTLYNFKQFLYNIIFAAVETGDNGDSREFPTGGYQSNNPDDLIYFDDYLRDESININERFQEFMEFIHFLEDGYNNSNYRYDGDIKLLDIDNINNELKYLRKNIDKKEAIDYINSELEDQELENTIKNKLNLYKNFIELKKEEFLMETYGLETYEYENIINSGDCFSFSELSKFTNNENGNYKTKNYNAFENKYCAVDQGNKPVEEYKLINSYVSDYIADYGTVDFLSKTNKISVNTESSLKDIIKLLLYDDKAVSYLRRYFRNNDWIVNNTKLGKQFGRFDNYISISKTLTTDNAKKLNLCLQDLLKYIRQNISTIKTNYKIQNNLFKNINFDIKNFTDKLSKITNMQIDMELKINNDKILSLNITDRGIYGDTDINNLLYIKETLIKLKSLPHENLVNIIKNYPIKTYSNEVKVIYKMILNNEFDNLIKLIGYYIEILKGSITSKDEKNYNLKQIYKFFKDENPDYRVLSDFNYFINNSNLILSKFGELNLRKKYSNDQYYTKDGDITTIKLSYVFGLKYLYKNYLYKN